MSIHVPIAQARPRLTEILEAIQREPVTITKDGRPAAVVLHPDDYESMVATLEVMRNPELQMQIAAYEMAKARGTLDLIPHEEVMRDLRDAGA
jgi:prevent-host-death family protein